MQMSRGFPWLTVREIKNGVQIRAQHSSKPQNDVLQNLIYISRESRISVTHGAWNKKRSSDSYSAPPKTPKMNFFKFL